MICTVSRHDLENDPDIVALVGCLGRADHFGHSLPGPHRRCRVGYVDGEYVLNPTRSKMADPSSTCRCRTARCVLMVESEATSSEDVMLGAVMFGTEAFQPVIDAIIELAEACAKEPGMSRRPKIDTCRREARADWSATTEVEP